jgi:hypothetical protein
MAGGVLSLAQAVDQAHDGVKAWQNGERAEAAVNFIGAAGPGLAFFGPIGKGLSVTISLGTVCYKHRDRIRKAFA